ncbi:hypothetical protein DSO57_1004137 [Entomophthora muscae]|uniref:Uncharacterized protein n=1 Tax=Entomophthora muscae TaxID=34485 RepID=A0ACC2TKA7_9FUNG|nr:hypothetical protein DSO57_1004137 [Entomophthora muscae]
MSELPHIFYPGQGEEDTYCQSCRRFATSKTSQEEWEKLNRHLEMLNMGRLLKDWYRPTEGLAPAEVQVHGWDARLVMGKVLEEFALMQAQYKLLASQHPLLVNDGSSKPVPGYDPGHTLGTGDQEAETLLMPDFLTFFQNPDTERNWYYTIPGFWYTNSLLSENPPICEKPRVYQVPHKPIAPTVFHHLASAFLLHYLSTYFFLG